MNTSLTISTAPLEHPAMDYTLLRKEGIRHLERMAEKFWTDINAHDPDRSCNEISKLLLTLVKTNSIIWRYYLK